MNTLIAASLFDSPWAVVVIILVGTLVNWLSQRRQRQKPIETEGAEPSTPAEPLEKFDVEAALRRLLGQPAEPPAAPPPLESRPAQTAATVSPAPPALSSGARVRPLASIRNTAAAQLQQARSLPRQPRATPTVGIIPVVDRRHSARSHPRTHHRWKWHSRQSMRQALIASLVFSPPKGLEP